MKDDKDTDRKLGRKLAAYETRPAKLTFDTLHKNYVAQKKRALLITIIKRASLALVMLGISLAAYFLISKNTPATTSSSADPTFKKHAATTPANKTSSDPALITTSEHEAATGASMDAGKQTGMLNEPHEEAHASAKNTQLHTATINTPGTEAAKNKKPSDSLPPNIASANGAGAVKNTPGKKGSENTKPLIEKTKPLISDRSPETKTPGRKHKPKEVNQPITGPDQQETHDPTRTKKPAAMQAPKPDTLNPAAAKNAASNKPLRGKQPPKTISRTKNKALKNDSLVISGPAEIKNDNDASKNNPPLKDSVSIKDTITGNTLPVEKTEPTTNDSSIALKNRQALIPDSIPPADTLVDTKYPPTDTAKAVAETPTVAAAPALIPPAQKRHHLLFSAELVHNTTTSILNNSILVPDTGYSHTPKLVKPGDKSTNNSFSGTALFGYKYKNAGIITGLGFLHTESQMSTEKYVQQQDLHAQSIFTYTTLINTVYTMTTLVIPPDSTMPPTVVTHTIDTVMAVTRTDTSSIYTGTKKYVIVNGDSVDAQAYNNQVRFFTIPFQLNYSFNLLRKKLLIEPQAGIQLGIPLRSYQLIANTDGSFSYLKRKVPLKNGFILLDASLKVGYRLGRNTLLYVKQGYYFNSKSIYRKDYSTKYALTNLYSAVGITFMFD